MSYKVGILAMYLTGRKLEEVSYFRKLSVTGRKMGIEVLVFTPDDVVDSGERVLALSYNPEQKSWVRKKVSFPPIIYDRCRYHGTNNYQKLMRFRTTYSKLHFMSRPLANKWKMHQILSEEDRIASHLPSTVRYQGTEELKSFLKRHSVVFLKPSNGTGGRGILRLLRTKDSEVCLMQGRDPNRRILPIQHIHVDRLHDKLQSWKIADRYIMQQGIPLQLPDGRVHDYRMLVQKDGAGKWQVTGCAGRIGPSKSVTSNLHGGGTAIAMEVLLRKRFGSSDKVEEIRRTAYALGLNTVKHLESKFGKIIEVGIDLAVDPKGNVWLLEVNPKPSREVFHRIGDSQTYQKAIRRPLEYALWLLKQKSPNSEQKADP
ncbi:YheC/YheD family protein [Paenibacillus allorhizosphaerae]|uniref:Endospore coat-associated protein YheD n=1 Tax=Paenibacillus allorhizosphaerae TaxID=2849866 RepID=A0ABM8VEF3_9BACL|nr:YheC/YheD family protein [Paenibacillus allorhizosphaerae]CAG7631175.1 Endospore coat-associated protein YheD [Paenibacillus allorhizosphaerae]